MHLQSIFLTPTHSVWSGDIFTKLENLHYLANLWLPDHIETLQHVATFPVRKIVFQRTHFKFCVIDLRHVINFMTLVTYFVNIVCIQVLLMNSCIILKKKPGIKNNQVCIDSIKNMCFICGFMLGQSWVLMDQDSNKNVQAMDTKKPK